MEYKLTHIENRQTNDRDFDLKFWQLLQTSLLLALKEQNIINETQYLIAVEQIKKADKGRGRV